MNQPKKRRQLPQFRFLTSAVDMKGCPSDSLPEVGIVGRSNAGKSSLINGLAGAKLAKVSGTPGKTRLLNFFQSPQYRLVDMPGYGFSSRSGSEQSSWQGMIEPYLATRGNLVGLLIVMDIRRDWSQDEENLLDWLEPRGVPSAVVLTKADKLSRGDVLKRVKLIQSASGVEDVLATSSLKRTGCEQLEEFFFESWVKPVLGPNVRKEEE